MKKTFNLLIILIITSLALPFGVNTVLADGKTYDDIEDGTYDITAKAMDATEDKASGAAGFINNEATLAIKNGKVELTIGVPNIEMAEISGIQIEGKEAAKVNESGNVKYYTYKLADLKTELVSQVQYVVDMPEVSLDHDKPFRFMLKGLDKLPVKEEEPVVEVKTETKTEQIKFETVEENDSSLEKGETKVKQEGVNGTKEVTYEVTYTDGKETERTVKDESTTKEPVNEIILIGTKESASGNKGSLIKNPDQTEELNYKSDIDLERNFNNPVKLLKKDGKEYIQITGTGGQFIKSLTINGKEAILGDFKEDKKGTYVMQFEVTKDLSEKLKFNMKIDTNSDYGVMEHDALLWFEEKAAPKPDVEVKTETKTESVKFKTREKNDSSLEKGETKVKQKGVNGTKEVTYEVTYTDGKETNRAVKSESTTKEPVNEIILIGTKELKEDKLTPDKAFEIDYVVKHGTKDETSAADTFFKKPAHLFYKDGKKYVQLTVTSSDMIDQLKTADGEVIIVKKNSDGSMVIQFKVGDDLSKAVLLDMHITVPGMYSMDHSARLFLDESSLKEIDVSKFLLVASDGKNGPTVKGAQTGDTVGNGEDNTTVPKPSNGLGNGGKTVDNSGKTTDDATPIKPNFGSNDNGDNASSDAGSVGKAQNPQTGDTSGLLMYALLLLGSAIPLTMKFKRHFS